MRRRIILITVVFAYIPEVILGGLVKIYSSRWIK